VTPGEYAVTFESAWTDVAPASKFPGEAQCTELLYTATGVLEQREWAVDQTAPAGWSTLATGLSTDPTTAPFSLPVPSAAQQAQQLTVDLVGVGGTTAAAVSSTTDATFTAVDSTSASPPTNPVCSS
jgi:hypothetical protein